ncbi:NAD(P)/FAD-dependent oxidoreductase [Falsirhodobacter sp. 20TX0035]|uniref:NAD(P)/FAD-dependent oxidoreductase n=1 Tax=Falsirhodobacter sp. 20TX0035 TaxID=3022019 RepID=UPI00232E267A|nr:NAD(P)/FAD-dependent oxidoreductase [Falsirhodobacter sp. 20TX0035]MDB6454307.1 FAD-dependent oxidoreductase [Falsirhodobacter sp. 20TX0035]
MTRVLIVGAGPAGIRAAETLVKAGLRPVIVDEAARAGGQIYRRPPEGFRRTARTLYGSEAAKAEHLHATFDALVTAGQVEHLPEHSVFALRNGVAHATGPNGLLRLPYDRLILSTGATDRVVPVPGWQSAGVYTLGAAQIALKAQGMALGRRIVLAGSGPLLTLVAAQLVKAGAGVAAVLDTSSYSDQMWGAAGMAAARPWVTLRGLRMRAGLGRLYHAGVRLERIETDANGPVALHWQDARGRWHETPCDAVAMGWHLRAETQLADLAGARFQWSADWAQWLPQTDALGRAGPELYLAGDGVRILGADGAERAGTLAAHAVLEDLGQPASGTAALLRRAARLDRFARAMARAFPWPGAQVRALPDATVLCRCEGITAGELRGTVPMAGAEANRVKSLARVGMGRCQGRYCQLAAAELIAGQAGCAVAQVGRLRGQPPVRPVPIAALLDAPEG